VELVVGDLYSLPASKDKDGNCVYEYLIYIDIEPISCQSRNLYSYKFYNINLQTIEYYDFEYVNKIIRKL